MNSERVRALSGAGFLLLGATLIQVSAAIVIPAFDRIGPSATSAWRFLLGAIVLLAVTRPRLRAWTKAQWFGALTLGLSVAAMNQSFYQAIARIPLGDAVAIEFLGPFIVAAVGKRTPRHLAFVGVAGIGVLLLTRPGSGLSLAGVAFAILSGLGWAIYVFASHRLGGLTEGFEGLAVSMVIAAVVTLPLSLGRWSMVTGDVHLLGRLALVGVMSIVLGFGAEMQGLRRVKPVTAAVLFSSDPAFAFLVGWIILSQRVNLADLLGVAFVVVAGIGVTYDSSVGAEDLAQ